MDRWKNLYDRFVVADEAQRRRLRAERARAEAIRAFDAWCAEAVDRVMHELHVAATGRAADFAHHTGACVDVRYPARPAISALPDGPFMTFLNVEVASSQVHLYSHRLSRAWPLIHMILIASNPGAPPPSLRARTLVTMPGCMIVQSPHGAHELRRVCPADPQLDGSITCIEELVYRCFEMLVDGLRRAA